MDLSITVPTWQHIFCPLQVCSILLTSDMFCSDGRDSASWTLGSRFRFTVIQHLRDFLSLVVSDHLQAGVRNMAGERVKTMRSSSHIFAIIFLQIIIVILFALFVRWAGNFCSFFTFSFRYDPNTAQRSAKSIEKGAGQIRDIYPSKFQFG